MCNFLGTARVIFLNHYYTLHLFNLQSSSSLPLAEFAMAEEKCHCHKTVALELAAPVLDCS